MFPVVRFRLALMALAIACGCHGMLRAAEPGSPLVLLAQTQEAAEFVSFDAELNLRFRRGETPVEIPASELLCWGTLRELRGRETVILTDGSFLGGTVARIDGSGAQLEHPVFDPIDVPRQVLRGIVLRRPASPLEFDRLVYRLAHENFSHDTLLLENGDSLSGTLVELPAEAADAATAARQTSIALESEGTRFETPLERVAAIAFRSAKVPPKSTTRLQVGLRQGDLLQVASAAMTGRSLRLQLAVGLTLITDPEYLWADVTHLHGNAPQAVPLTSLEALSYRHLPLLGWETPLAVDRNVLGGRLRAGGGVYATGLSMPGSSRVAFRLEGAYRQFIASAALDEAAGRRGSVVFRVYRRQGTGPLELAWQSEVIRGGDAPQPIRLDVTGTTQLVLLVDHADRGDELDYADWLDTVLVK